MQIEQKADKPQLIVVTVNTFSVFRDHVGVIHKETVDNCWGEI